MIAETRLLNRLQENCFRQDADLKFEFHIWQYSQCTFVTVKNQASKTVHSICISKHRFVVISAFVYPMTLDLITEHAERRSIRNIL